ncbi:antibiotic resistance protein VanZ [Sporosarcina sp. FSL K6-5500]|uniref:antibiotic resistance protein VanZ n=1 Tax=Sporosarcina sp. FSL K6-5500 TaxID=2921558 RepID=UPI0030FC241C
MFYGTRWFYRMLYFVTAMAPAYFLFLLQIDDKFNQPLEVNLAFKGTSLQLNVFWWCGILLILVITLSFLLRKLLIRQYTHSSTNQVLPPDKDYFKENKLEEINGNVISFLLGIVIPAVLIIENNIIIAFVVFIIIQFLIYILIMKSTDIFPNILLIIMGVSLCKTQHNNYVFIFKSKKYQEFKVYVLGDPQKTKMHITMYKK